MPNIFEQFFDWLTHFERADHEAEPQETQAPPNREPSGPEDQDGFEKSELYPGLQRDLSIPDIPVYEGDRSIIDGLIEEQRFSERPRRFLDLDEMRIYVNESGNPGLFRIYRYFDEDSGEFFYEPYVDYAASIYGGA